MSEASVEGAGHKKHTDTRFDGYGLRCSLPTRPRVQASYPVLVHRHTPLLHASFRPRLATTPLRFASPSPPSGWIRDFYPQTVEHARHTSTPTAWKTPSRFLLSHTTAAANQFELRFCIGTVKRKNSHNGVPETCAYKWSLNDRQTYEDRHVGNSSRPGDGTSIKRPKTFAQTNFSSINFSLAVRRRTIHFASTS